MSNLVSQWILLWCLTEMRGSGVGGLQIENLVGKIGRVTGAENKVAIATL